MKIILIEDESGISEPIQETLTEDGLQVDCVDSAEEGEMLLGLNSYDCMILDLNLPGKSGMTLLRQMRTKGDLTPVLILTAYSQIENKIAGFDNGADDYLTKPFNLAELLSRVKALIRRNSLNQTHRLQLNNFLVFPEQNCLIDEVNDIKIELSNKEIQLLEYLLRNKGKIISSEELLEHVWDSEIDLFTDTVKTHIKTLRKKIDPDKKIIKTMRGKGYYIE